jgi:hypothetical protein
MGGLKTIPATCLALILAAPHPVHAFDNPDLPRLFADCAGRYSAMTEHLWMFDGPASEITATRRDAFADLAMALADDTTTRALRIEAKAAQAALMSAAAFGGNARAAQTARIHLQVCDALLPGA